MRKLVLALLAALVIVVVVAVVVVRSSQDEPAVEPPTAAKGCSGWLSGSTGRSGTDGTFAQWRGAPADLTGSWQYSADLKDLQPGAELGSWQAELDLAVVPNDFTSWQAEAAGAHDEFWRQTFQNLEALRGGRAQTFVRPYWEFNGDWYAWSVRDESDAASFKQAWARMASIFRAEFPQGKLMLGTTASNRIAVADTYPDDVDLLSIDFYNNYPYTNTQEAFDRKVETGSDPNSLMDLMRLAQTKGDPVMISEWGNVGPATSGGGGDSPEFISAFYNFVATHCGTGPGQIVGELLFNFPSHGDGQFWLWDQGQVNPQQPLAAERYRQLFGRV